ncbi:MAG: hypothetical protein JF612_02990, partial [Planctomycetia bacterium]|nr:hypothetical protein [Planctomycetia bacterium]
DKLDVDTKPPKIPFRETIQTNAEGSYRHKKQSGGRGQFGEVHIRMYPFPRGTKAEEFCTKQCFPHMKEFHFDEQHNFVWINSVVGGTIPTNFLPAVEKGFKERIEKGVIAGYTVQDVAVEVHLASTMRSIARKPRLRSPALWRSATYFRKRGLRSSSRS